MALIDVPSTEAQQTPPSGDPSILAPGATVDTLFTQGSNLTEGVSAGHDGMIYFSDIPFAFRGRHRGSIEAGRIWRHDPRTCQTTIFRSPSGKSNGIKFDAQGRMIAAEGADFGGRRVIRTDMCTGKSEIIAAMYEGRRFNSPNDITIDLKGRIYFSDPRYNRDFTLITLENLFARPSRTAI